MGTGTIVSFVAFLAAFVAIGVWSATRKQDTPEDYLVASRNVNPWLAALSGVATNNSGFMFLGLIGATYTGGISAAWIMIGWIAGDWVSWFVVPKRLREQSAKTGATSIPGFLAGTGQGARSVAVVAGLIVLVFLSVYASAQLVAGGKALHKVSGWSQEVGATLGAVMVAVYCFAGGIRASIWTDVAQSMVMIVSMTLVFVLAVSTAGGMGPMWDQLASIDPTLTQWFPNASYKFGVAGYILGWFGGGLGTIGQPHVMIRTMAVDSVDNIKTMRRIYISWYWLFSAACIAVGLAARVLLDGTTGPDYDAELAILDVMPAANLGPVFVGLTLAGIFAATISTADSQILSCSAAFTQDVWPAAGRSFIRIKAATLAVTGFALLLAFFGPPSVFGIVTLAWATLAAGLGPLMVIRTMGWRADAATAIATMLSGIAANFVWRFALELQGDVYDVLPGMTVGFAVYFAMTYLQSRGMGSARPDPGTH